MRDDWLRWPQADAAEAAKADLRRALGAFWSPTGDAQQPWPTPMGDPTELFRVMWDTWFSVAETMVSNVWGMGQQVASTAAAATDPPGQESLSLEVAAGGTTRGTLWLKNRSSTTLEEVRVRSSLLENSRGSTISGSHIQCRLYDTERVVAGANVRVDIVVDVPRDADPGVYHGTLLVEDHEDACRPLRLDVRG